MSALDLPTMSRRAAGEADNVGDFVERLTTGARESLENPSRLHPGEIGKLVPVDYFERPDRKLKLWIFEVLPGEATAEVVAKRTMV